MISGEYRNPILLFVVFNYVFFFFGHWGVAEPPPWPKWGGQPPPFGPKAIHLFFFSIFFLKKSFQ
jgi:hypothetical protein